MWEYHDPYHPAADELYHFKYIKRVLGPNGKWQYYYDRDALKADAQRIATRARRATANARAKFNTASYYARKGVNEAASNVRGAYRNTRNNAIRKGVDARNAISERASRTATKVKRKFNTAKFIAGRRIDSAKSAARDAFENAKGAARNARNNAIRRGVDARNNIGNAVNRAARTASNWTKAKITTAVQKRARRRKGWNG